jgi:hypothetical protein
VEARVGIEPTHKGFADLSLTAWVPRLASTVSRSAGKIQSYAVGVRLPFTILKRAAPNLKLHSSSQVRVKSA